jgi:hypothetical protein
LVDSAASATTYARVQHWVATNKLKVAIGLVSVGGIVYLLMKEKRHRKKRRAKKAGNGARLEVVVVAGSPSEPITRSISLDLERRGFIVYIVCNTIEEEVLVHNESRPDIRPLMIDIVDVSTSTAHVNLCSNWHSPRVHAPPSSVSCNSSNLHTLPSKVQSSTI